jgi:5'-deoxynucleotidase YfbR-like HD superfamily hydrolase
MSLSDIDVSAFPKEREEKLRSIQRFSLFEVMLYRSSLWQHTHRVLWIVEELLPHASEMNIDPEKARALALVHDDAEMVTGDYQAGHKAKMTPEQLKKLDEEEEEAVQELVKKYPKTVHGYEYGTLLRHAIHKDCNEALLVMYADKFDAYNETLHEVYAGNLGLLWSLMFYEQWLAGYAKKYPPLASFTTKQSPFILSNNNRFQPHHVVPGPYQYLGKPYTRESISHPTDSAFYNAWRTLVLERAGAEEGTTWLTEQREFLPF